MGTNQESAEFAGGTILGYPRIGRKRQLKRALEGYWAGRIAADVEELLDVPLEEIPAAQLWVNPDCGLKTRRYEEIVPALGHLVAAAKDARTQLGKQPAGV